MAPVEVTDDYYAALKIPQKATPSEIRKSYLRLAKIAHPDKNRGDPKAADAFALINAAYETLSDPTRKREYDLCLPKIAALRRSKEAAAVRKKAEDERFAEREMRRAKARAEDVRRQAENQQQAEERKRKDDAKLQRKAEAKRQSAEHRRQADTHQRPTFIHLSTLSTAQIRELKAQIDRDIFELARQIRRLEKDTKQLDVEESSAYDDCNTDRQSRDPSRSTAYYQSFPTSTSSKSEVKAERERTRLQRSATKRIKEDELRRKKTRLAELNSEMRAIDEAIGAPQKPPVQSTKPTAQQPTPQARPNAEDRTRQKSNRRNSEGQQKQDENILQELRKQMKEEWLKNPGASIERDPRKKTIEELHRQERAEKELEELLHRLSAQFFSPQPQSKPTMNPFANQPRQPQPSFGPSNVRPQQPQPSFSAFNFQPSQSQQSFKFPQQPLQRQKNSNPLQFQPPELQSSFDPSNTPPSQTTQGFNIFGTQPQQSFNPFEARPPKPQQDSNPFRSPVPRSIPRHRGACWKTSLGNLCPCSQCQAEKAKPVPQFECKHSRLGAACFCGRRLSGI